MGIDVSGAGLVLVGHFIFVNRENPPTFAPSVNVMINMLFLIRHIRIFVIFVQIVRGTDFYPFAFSQTNRVSYRGGTGNRYAFSGIGNQPVHSPERLSLIGFGGFAGGLLSGGPNITLTGRRRIHGTRFSFGILRRLNLTVGTVVVRHRNLIAVAGISRL